MGGRGSGSGRSGGGGGGRPAGPIRLDAMSDARLASFIQQSNSAQLPPGYRDDPTQRLILAAQWNEQPQIVSSAQAEALARKRGAVALYRTVNDDHRYSGKSSQQIADEFRTGAQFQASGHGGQAYGGGAYFSNSHRGSQGYGYGSASTIGAVLNDKARVIDASALDGSTGISWIQSHPTAARALGVSVRSGRVQGASTSKTAMAMAMGYNAVSNNVGAREKYYTIFDRSILTTSTKNYYTTKSMKGR